MSSNNVSLDCGDVIEYWLTLFPELDGEDELHNVLMQVSASDLRTLAVQAMEPPVVEQNEFLTELIPYKSRHLKDDLLVKMRKEMLFFSFYEPILAYFADRYNDGLQTISIVADKEDFLRSSVVVVAEALTALAQRTMILEINIARLQGNLRGEDSQQRFDDFRCRLLADERFLTELYREYSTLTQVLCNKAQESFTNLLDILRQTEQEAAALADVFHAGEPIGRIVSVETDMGDTHNGGKSVAQLVFDTGLRLVFKPRNMGIEVAFQSLLTWLNEQSGAGIAGMRTVEIHESQDGECGWMEFVTNEECRDREGMAQFYVRTGQLLAVLYTVNAMDFHFENLIAHGEHPVLIDLETLFHHKVKGLTNNPFISNSIELAQGILEDSVYSIGLLPQRISNRVDNQDVSLEISGFGAETDQLAPFKSMSIENVGSDTIHIGKQLGIVYANKNNPKVNGEVGRSEHYMEEIQRGFETVYRWILGCKEEFVQKLHQLFAGGHIRYVVRPTYIYGQLLSTSYHPDFMRDSVHRDVLIHRIGILASDKMRPLLGSERHDLLRGDVPYFKANVDNTSLIDSRGNHFTGFFDQTPFEQVAGKIRNKFSEHDLRQQLRFIRMSFRAKATDVKKEETGVRFAAEATESSSTAAEWMELATKIGEHIIENSIFDQDEQGQIDRTWISTVLEGRDEIQWSLAPVGNDLYNGNSGIALFLGYLGKITGREEFTQAALEAAYSVIKEVEILKLDHPYLNGAYNGLSGYFYMIALLGELTNDEKLLRIMEERLPFLHDIASGDNVYDLIGGSTGSLAITLALYDRMENPELKQQLLTIARANYEHLKNHCVELENGRVVWESNVTIPCTGYSHGNAGIATYLSRLAIITGDTEIHSFAQKVLAFERDLFDAEYQNWYTNLLERRMVLAWCHGAPGILLSRVLMKSFGYCDDTLDQEIESALHTTIHKSFGHNPSYCHGDLGNLEIVGLAAQVLGDADLQARCLATFGQLFEEVLVKRWDNGVMRGTDSMSLMVGLAGFGYSLLRHAKPQEVPPVLWFV